MKLVILFSITSICLIFALFLVNKKEKYGYEYDYDRENPNALISGYPIAGTVYSSEPNNTPGLGWIL
jgi:hypothetical protein